MSEQPTDDKLADEQPNEDIFEGEQPIIVKKVVEQPTDDKLSDEQPVKAKPDKLKCPILPPRVYFGPYHPFLLSVHLAYWPYYAGLYVVLIGISVYRVVTPVNSLEEKFLWIGPKRRRYPLRRLLKFY